MRDLVMYVRSCLSRSGISICARTAGLATTEMHRLGVRPTVPSSQYNMCIASVTFSNHVYTAV